MTTGWPPANAEAQPGAVGGPGGTCGKLVAHGVAVQTTHLAATHALVSLMQSLDVRDEEMLPILPVYSA